jgi:UMF1 family MFS transporter
MPFVNSNPAKKIIRSWCMYDWANSAFATTAMAAVLPLYFRNVAAISLPGSQHYLATSIWGYTTAAAMLIAALLSILLGPVSDYGSLKKTFLGWFMGLGVLATAMLVFTGPGDWIWVALLFILGNIGWASSEVFYDSLLPHITGSGNIDSVSARGYALGYAGGGILLAVNIIMIWILPKTALSPAGEPVPVLGMKLCLLSVALWWGFFSIPLFRHVPEPAGVRKGLSGERIFRIGPSRLTATFRDIRQYRPLFLFLLAFWFYNDGIGTVMKMAIAYGDEIGIGTLDLIGALLLTQVLGIPCSLAFGRLARRFQAKPAILLGLGIYVLISIGAVFMTRALHFWILAGLVGLVMGGTQALSRSLYGAMVPKNKSAEFFSFYTISGKFAGIIGPVSFAFAGQIFGSSRFGAVSLIFFFLAGGLLLLKVDVKEGMKTAERTSL